MPYTPDVRLPDYMVPGLRLGSLSPLHVMDGTAYTIMFAEGGEAVPWTKPDELTVPFRQADGMDEQHKLPSFGGVFADGFHAVKVDGTILFLKNGYPAKSLAKLLTPAGGETIEESDYVTNLLGYQVSPSPELADEIKTINQSLMKR